jgi:hypothetical protein
MSVTTNRISAPPGREPPQGEGPPQAPLFDQFMYVALRKVARGEIGTISSNGALRHRTEELSARLVGALFVLYRDGFVAVSSEPDPRDGWFAAKLTMRGTQLLGEWAARES